MISSYLYYLVLFLCLVQTLQLSNEIVEQFHNKSNLISRELEQWKRAVKEMKQKDINLRGFYHTSSWAPYWKDVLLEQLIMMDGKRVPRKWSSSPNNISDMDVQHMYQTKVSLLEEVDQLYLNIAGETSKDFDKIKSYVESLKLKYFDHIHFNYNKTAPRGAYNNARNSKQHDLEKAMANNYELSEGESSTIMTLHNYCKDMKNQRKKAYIFYLHNKGGCCVRGKPRVSYNVEPVASWREGMNTFNIEFPSICLRALLSGYSACGMELQDAHHSGNFWWANCDHIASLPPLQNRYDAWGSEFFLYRISPHYEINKLFANNCGYSTYKCIGVNHYDHECLRSVYRKKIMQYVTNYELPPNDVATISRKFDWVSNKCGSLREIPYDQQEWWIRSEKFPLRQKISQN
jgi:hypothetical protein